MEKHIDKVIFSGKTILILNEKAIIADTEVLKNAPIEMIRAGYGDIIGKYCALCD